MKKDDKEDDAVELPEYRDQGFTRCKILVLLPVASVAQRFLKVLLSLLPTKYSRNIQNWKRWQEEFEPAEGEGVDAKKPADFRYLFDGATSDAFRVGLRFIKGKIKLYSSFYESDIIIASPLGLRMIIGNELESKREIDFLSSVEIVFADMFHAFSMQNIEHVETVFQSLNTTPYAAHNADFSRIREWNLNGHGRYFRQNIFISDYSTPDCLRIFNSNCFNSYGKLQLRSLYDGQLGRVLTSVRQYFTRIEVKSLQSAADERYQYFVDSVLPQLRSRTFTDEAHLLVFIPSYFDYVRIRNLCKERRISFCNACEYTRPQEISRSRSAFFHGETKVMLFTERFHFFRRYNIRGVHHIIFFGLPANAHFYTEAVNWCENESKGTVIALYTKYESTELERIVGSQFAHKMLQSSQSTHTFT
jgi:U3 small nucleolar RNA-associated protein 25